MEIMKIKFINPQHMVPTLDDNGLILNESRAIATYLVDKYSKDDTLYPRDIKKRALVNQMLYFDATTLSAAMRAVYKPVLNDGEKIVTERRVRDMNNGLNMLNLFLNDNPFVCGPNLTLADLSMVTAMSTLQEMKWEHLPHFKNIPKWLQLCSQNIPDYDENIKGAKSFAEIYHSLLGSK